MSQAVLKGFLCRNDTGKGYGVIEYPKHKIQVNVSDAIEMNAFLVPRDWK